MKNKALKSIIASLLSVAMLMSFVACGGSGSGEDKKNNSAGASASDNADVNSDRKLTIDKNAQVGDYITFGSYEQDNNISNGKEDIEWLVLEVRDGKALVISKYALDCKQYNEEYVDTSWENCTLRAWLNNDFYNTAFSDTEKNEICTTNIIAEDNFESGTDAGNDTQDKVFLLSISEVETYFSSDEERMCKPSKYAINNGVFEYVDSYEGNCWWWLRSPGTALNYASYIYGGGIVVYDGEGVDFGHAIRPAMWIAVG